MRHLPLLGLIVGLLGPGISSLRGEDLETTDGHTFKNVVVVGEEADRIKVKHVDGSGWIAKKLIPEAFAKSHGLQSSDVAARELAEDKKNQTLIIDFKYRFKEVKTTDARTYPSSAIVGLEIAALKLQREGGIERVKLADLIPEQREVLHFDSGKARQAESDAKHQLESAHSAEEAKLFAQTSVRGTVIYAHVHVTQKVPDGYICTLWQIVPSQANASLAELVNLAGAVEDHDPQRYEIIQESTRALFYSPKFHDFVVVRQDVFPVQVLVANLPLKVLETHAYRGPLFLVGKYRFQSSDDSQSYIPLAYPTQADAENYVAQRGLGAYLRDEMAPQEDHDPRDDSVPAGRKIRKRL